MSRAATLKNIAVRWLQRSSLIALALVALLIVAAFAATYLALNTERGTQWALRATQRLLPELSIASAQGTFLQGLRAGNIRWLDGDVDIAIERAHLQLRFAPLLRGEVDLSFLRAETVRIAPLGPSSDAPIKLPRIILPFALSASELKVQRLEIVNNKSVFALHNIRSAIKWRATTLQFTQTQLQWHEIALSADGDIGFRGDYPLHIKGQLHLPQWPQPVAIQTGGDLRKLKLQVQSAAPYALRANAQLATLDNHLPLQLHAELSQPFARTFGEERFEIKQGHFDARGDLTQIEGNVSLTLSDSRYGPSKLDGSAHWQPEKLQVQIDWQPGSGDLQLRCDAILSKPIGANCNGTATALPLTPWLDGQTASLSSTIKLDAQWLDPQWSLALALPDITGQFNSAAIAANIDLRTNDGERWQLQPSQLRIGPNEVKGSGEFGARNRLQLAVDARDLAHLHARAAGSITGHISLEGDTVTPTVRAQLKGQRLQFDNVRAAQMSLNAMLPELGHDSGRIAVEARGLASGQLADMNLTVSISGDRSQQHWNLHAQKNGDRLELRCATRSATGFDDWQLACPQLSGRMRGTIAFDWRNNTTLRARAQLSKNTFELAPFCLQGEDSELCLEQMLRYVDASLQPVAAHARGIPLRWLEPWLPEEFDLINDARLSARAQLRSLAPLAAQAHAEIPQTRWRLHTANATRTAEINAIRLDATLDEKRAVIATSAHSPSIGRIDAQLAIDDPRTQRSLDGRIDIVQLQLGGFAWALQGLDAVSGEINGAIDIGGTASAPRLHGQLLLKDGNALWAPLGAPFRSVHADLSFDNDSARLGGWFALGQGGGDIDGTLQWSAAENNWQLQLGLVAGGLSAMPFPDSSIVFSPHVQLSAAPQELHLNGYIDVASADIQLKELPPETTDVSQDQEIVGQPVDADAWKLWATLGLNLGDQFHLSGFGADVNLSGRLQLNKAPGDNMHLYGEVKVPRGRYRAYGQRLSVRKGSVIFYGPPDNPDLNLEAVRDMPPGVTDVVGLRVIGSLKTPEALLFSEPSMPDSDIAYYLLTGRKPVAGATGTSGYSASGALLSLGLAGSESKAGQLAEKFGIADLQLGTSESKDGQSEAEISGQLGRDLYVRYGRGLGQQGNSISFQYRLTPKLMIETISGVSDALDLLYSFEIK